MLSLVCVSTSVALIGREQGITQPLCGGSIIAKAAAAVHIFVLFTRQ